ncbi:hypothetical protein [Streptomyces phaeochromogenes]|uniref:hypothetical protein n=1 Tax=Streptomyces phaeochromogenes TaxID=1923 RepID=UPI0037159331
MREHRRSIDLVRYRYFGSAYIGLETVASIAGKSSSGTRERRRAAVLNVPRKQTGPMADLAKAADEVLIGLGDGVTRVQRKQYAAYQRLRNFASAVQGARLSETTVDFVPGFTRDVTGRGHYGTGDLEVRLCTERDLERAHDLFRLSYSAA